MMKSSVQSIVHGCIQAVFLIFATTVGAEAPVDAPPRTVDFAEEVQPVLRRHCFRCHGNKNHEAGLQLNVREQVLGNSDSNDPVVVKHHADQSLLIKRVTDPEFGDLMPPDGERLSNREIGLLKTWIEQGASWPDEFAGGAHWAYQPITRPSIPESVSAEQTVDYFINQKLDARGLQANPSLDRARALRRVSLALIGLPPSPDQTKRFVNDDNKGAFEREVDRLLASPRYGERWAVPWLDMARYADSNGFQADQIRDNWAYRDWVIRAFNRGMPFDEFVVDQIAGDLHPDPTLDQRVATGFHRMTTCNVEAGVHPEANRVNQVVDRVNTTATVFLGSTIECAQCHDHKYDPFSQADYYRLFAYFNNTPLEVKNTSGVTWDFYGPKMNLPMDDSRAKKRTELEARIAELKIRRQQLDVDSDDRFKEWLAGLKDSDAGAWQPLVPIRFETTGGEQFEIQPDGAVLLSGNVPDTVDHTFVLQPGATTVTAIRVEILTDESIPGKGPGRGDAKRSNVILSEVTCEKQSGDRRSNIDLHGAVADFSQPRWDVANAIDGNRKTGWAIAGEFGKPHWASFLLSKPVEFDGQQEQLRVELGQYFGRGRVAGKPRVSIYTGPTEYLDVSDELKALAKKKLSKRNRKQLRAEFDRSNPALKTIDQSIAELEKQLAQVQPDTTLVMEEMPDRRETFIMVRGEYENLGDAVQPGTPEQLPVDPSVPSTGDRMELARWLTSSENPLLARVTVNRWWAELFGAGLVTTLEDFGTQADAPSHPLLLDWLASELIDSGWSMKHVQKLMVLSEAFQRSSRLSPAMSEVDPSNRLLARGPRFRLPAETIRDNALAISGLLSEKMYGPPIMPYQPDKIWRSVGRNQPKWIAAENEDRFRRGVYVVCKRAAPYPSFINFDAPDRGNCTVDRGRSNTPLQALTLLNDPAYAEMALALADRVISESPSSEDRSRLKHAFRLAVARDATDYEQGLLLALLKDERVALQTKPELIASRTKLPFPTMPLRSDDTAELAAWFAVANALLNLDETMNQ